MNWIEDRIRTEKRKHEDTNIDWIKIVSIKIENTLKNNPSCPNCKSFYYGCETNSGKCICRECGHKWDNKT